MSNDWLAALRVKLEDKGLDESDIAQCLEVAMAARGKTTKNFGHKEIKTSPQKEASSIQLIEIINHCPSCLTDDSEVHPGIWTKRQGVTGEVFKIDDNLIAPESAKVVKVSTQHQLCQQCLRKEQVLTKVERIAKNNIEFITALETLIKDYE